MEPIVAGGLVLGLTFMTLTFAGICNGVASWLYRKLFEPERATTIPFDRPSAETEQRRSA